jgi:hypothetical protein
MGLSLDFYFEILALFFALFFFPKRRNKLILLFIPFLLLTVLVEFVGWTGWTSHASFGKFAMYNIFTTIEFIFYFSLFFMHLKNQTLRSLVLFFIPVYVILVIVNLTFVQGLNKTFHTYTFLLGSFFIVIFCCCYFYESVLPGQVDEQLAKQPFFWICSGLLIYYLGSVIINALFDYLISNDMREQGIRIYNIITHSLNVILYSSFCISFYICPNSKKTYSLQ